MCDFFEDFDDGYDEGESMDGDSFEDSLKGEMDEAFAGDTELDDEPIEAESQGDAFTAKDTFILGGAMGFAFDEGLRERKRRKRERISGDSDWL